MKRQVYFLSDSTGITAESLGHCLLTQFDDIEFDTVEAVDAIITEINAQAACAPTQPLVFATFVNPAFRILLSRCEGLVFDFFSTYIDKLSFALQAKPAQGVGRSHSQHNYKDYTARIEAVNFALANDDGLNTHNYGQADAIIVGVSRSGKTPSSLYLALQFGIRVANYPLTTDELEGLDLPTCLSQHRQKLFGLVIDPHRLSMIRQQRYPNSQYANLQQCEYELRQIKRLFESENIPFIESTSLSIEEIATKIIAITGLKRRLQ
jgi:[pyruvate, water dikinase]-phosphate phosphotransferase / [pyruvate, water dikinase] kinase